MDAVGHSQEEPQGSATHLREALNRSLGPYYLVLSPRIELGIHPYQGCGMPFTYESNLVRGKGIEPLTKRWQRLIIPFN